MKKIATIIIVMAMSMSAFAFMGAQETSTNHNYGDPTTERTVLIKGNQVEVEVAENAANITQKELTELVESIVEDFPECGNIIIWNHQNEEKLLPQQQVQPRWGKKYTKKINNYNYTMGDYFITSVAKGAELKLSRKQTRKAEISVSGTVKIFELGLNSSIENSIETTRTFSGPPESSYYNSREYRIKAVGEKGECLEIKSSGNIAVGTFINPVKFSEYSIDSKQYQQR